jgi:hypothetical protein
LELVTIPPCPWEYISHVLVNEEDYLWREESPSLFGTVQNLRKSDTDWIKPAIKRRG